MPMQRAEHGMQHGIGYFIAALECMVTVDQYFRLHDRDDAQLLANRRVPSQHFGIGFDAERRRIAVGDAINLAPLGKTRALLLVRLEAFRQAIEALSDQIARRTR